MIEARGPTIIHRLRKAYLLSIGFLMFFILSCSLIIILAINNNVSHSELINVAGRQRLLSQNINNYAFGLYLSETGEDSERFRMELTTSLDLWTSVHLQLGEFGHSAKNRPLFTPDVLKAYNSIDSDQWRIAKAATGLLAQAADPDYGREDLKPYLKIIMDREKGYLTGMDIMVKLLDEQA